MPEEPDGGKLRRKAVALTYRVGAPAPKVMARGYGELADRIIAEAQRQGVYVHGAPELVTLLMQLDIDERIPPNLYHVIAELLIWVEEFRQDSQADGNPS